MDDIWLESDSIVDVATTAGTSLLIASNTEVCSSKLTPSIAQITRPRCCISTEFLALKNPQKACRRYTILCSRSLFSSTCSFWRLRLKRLLSALISDLKTRICRINSLSRKRALLHNSSYLKAVVTLFMSWNICFYTATFIRLVSCRTT